MEGKTVKLFTQPNCPACRMLKTYLDELGVNYTEVDISLDKEQARHLADDLGFMVVPTLEHDDGKVLAGFDKKKLGKFLGV